MWLTEDGIVNTMHAYVPEAFVEEHSHALLAKASDDELERLLLVLESVEDDAHDEIGRLGWSDAEREFEDRELPEDWLIWFDPGEWTLAERIDDVVRGIELRWRLDAAHVLEQTIWNLQDQRRGSPLRRLLRRIALR